MRSVSYVANNDVTLLETGQRLFPAMLAAIDAARHDILFETYIFAEDEVALRRPPDGDRLALEAIRHGRAERAADGDLDHGCGSGSKG